MIYYLKYKKNCMLNWIVAIKIIIMNKKIQNNDTQSCICIWFFRKIYSFCFFDRFLGWMREKYRTVFCLDRTVIFLDRTVIFLERTVIFMVTFLFSELIDRENRMHLKNEFSREKKSSILSLFCYQVVHNTASAYEQIFAVVSLLCINEIVCSLKIPFAVAIAMVCNLIASGCWW